MKYRVLIGAVTLAFVSGCGGSRIESGVDKEQTGDELDAAEIEDICDATVAYANETYTVEDRCAFRGVEAALELYTETLGNAPDSELMSECEHAYDACADRFDPNGGRDCNNAPEELKDCTSTVDEIETCYADTLDAVLEEIRKLPTCAEITGKELNDFLDRDTDLTPEVESCNTVAQSCEDGYDLADEF